MDWNITRRHLLKAMAAAPVSLYLPNLNLTGPPPPTLEEAADEVYKLFPNLLEFVNALPGNFGDGLRQVGFGVGIPWQMAETDETYYDRALTSLRPRWWYNWKFDQIGKPGYIPMFWRPELTDMKTWDKAVALANEHPEVPWLLYNEPERYASTANPKEAAIIMKEWVKVTTNTFSIAGLLTSVDDVSWLRTYLNAGGPIPDAWHFHIYGYSRPIDWLRALGGHTFLDWYQRYGAKRPVAITETNANTVSSIKVQGQIMLDIILILKLFPFVLGVGWYAAYDVFDLWPWANLLDADGNVTELGAFYRDNFGLPENG
jgi:putative glycosyl hydrolase